MTTPKPHVEITDGELAAADDAIIGRAFRWSLAVLAVAAVVVTGLVFAFRRSPEPPPPVEPVFVPPQAIARNITPPVVRFTDITEKAGIDFVHENGAYGDKLLPESMGGGVAFFDYDNDGDQDLLFVNSSRWPWRREEGDPTFTSALYRNDGDAQFANVTDASGLGIESYGMGVGVGDYDNDGWVDVFITAVGKNHLLRNVEGHFKEVTDEAGVGGAADEWSTSAAFVDVDNDGDLDLFVCNYVRWSKEIDFKVNFRFAGVGRAYGPPTNFEGTQPYFYRNHGDGTFSEAAEEAGLHVINPATGGPVSKALAVAPVDIDRNGHIDLLVANDTVQNFLFVNQGDGYFVEEGAQYGVAFDRNGSATGAMGIDSGFYRNDTDLAFFIGNFANEMSSAYVTQGSDTLFADESIGEGIGATSRGMLTFGLLLLDYDLDGRLDLLQTNGHLEEQINVVQPSQHYEQPSQLFYNCGGAAGATFVPVEPALTGDLSKPIVGRGSAFADIDGDGDLDVVMTQLGRTPLLLRNELRSDHHRIRVRLIGTATNKNAIGAWVVATVDGRRILRQIMPTRSYLSQSELPVTLGLGGAQKVERLEIRWPGQPASVFEGLDADRSYVIHQKQGITARKPLRH